MRQLRSSVYVGRMKSATFTVVPLSTEIADKARSAAKAGKTDHSTITVEKENTAPCRHCLRWANSGERVILFPYASIAAGRPYSESGPIFVHAESCARYTATDKYPDAFRKGRVFRAYNSDCDMIDAVILDTTPPEEVIEGLFGDLETAFIHVRSLDRGCYTMEVTRA